jgi:hypothetical protein
MSALSDLKAAQLRKLAATHHLQSALAALESGNDSAEALAQRDAATKELAAATGAASKALRMVMKSASQRH